MADLIADPFRAARLVLSLRRQGITNDAVLSALETVDRGAFVAPDLARMAGEDCAVPIECGQSIPRPIVTARLLKALNVSASKEDRVLVVGAGSGYTMTLLAQTCRHVYGVDRYLALVEAARERLDALKVDNVTLRHGDGLDGLSEHGPFDRILLAGSLKTIPASLIQQLARGGALVGAIQNQKGEQVLRHITDSKTVTDVPMPDKISALTKGVARSL
ncbi:MAG: methyltransferase domain-containing protein [Henriciella sp.]|nr:methyltransferase domain-containing protein [Henriciella sp.]